MQELYLEDYDVDLEFPDNMSEERIKQIIKRDYPEPDEKLVARFQNPDTPSSSLTQEDFERYLQAKPDMTVGRFAELAWDAATTTVGRLAQNLPEAIKTYFNPTDPGTASRSFVEGVATGTYDVETLANMGLGYLQSKINGFGGRTDDEKENEYRDFLKLKELQNVRSAIERGDQSAWNEYMEWMGMNSATIDPSKVNRGAAEFLGEFADPSLVIPFGKVGTTISKGVGKVAGGAAVKAGDLMTSGGRGLAGLRDVAASKIDSAASAVDEATGGLGRYAVPGGVGAAVGTGAVDLGTAGMGTALVAGLPASMGVAGGLLRGFGEAMKLNPSRTGGLARVAMNAPDTAAGKLAGGLKFLDTPINYAGRAASGAMTGATIGAGIGLATGGLEGMAQGLGSGAGLGAFGGTMGRFAEGVTGTARKSAQANDVKNWLEAKTPEDRAAIETKYKTLDDQVKAMDLEQIILGSTSEASPVIRYGTNDTVISQNKAGEDVTLKGSGGAYTEEGGRPVVYLNTDADLRTLGHETFHALARIDGFEVMTQRIKDQVAKLYKDQELDTFINEYEKRGKPLVDESGQPMGREKKLDAILEELGAEYFANQIKNKNSDYLFKGNPIREAIRGITQRFVAGKLDRVYNTFKSDIFDTPIKQSKALNMAMDDLVRARRRSGRNIDLAVDSPVRVYSDFDLSDDKAFQELVDMGAAKTVNGKRVMIKSNAAEKKIEAQRAAQLTKALDTVSDEGGLTRQPDGSYSGVKFSQTQIEALLADPNITGTLRKALEKLRDMPDDSGMMNVLYAAATTKTKKGLTRYANLPISNRDAVLYNFIISPSAGTMRVKVVDMSLLRNRINKEFANPETQKVFGSRDKMADALITYLNALASGETPTADVLGSASRRDILNKVLAVRNQKNNPLVPEGTMTKRQRRAFEANKDFPWRDFRLDRIIQMKDQGPAAVFSEDAYARAGVNFSPTRKFYPGQKAKLTERDLVRFSPSPDNPNADLKDLNGKDIQVLTSDSSGAKDKSANGVAVQFRGGPGHLALYDGWGFTNINSAKAFITRLRRDGFPLVGITSMNPNNHLNSMLARRYYGLKWEELVNTGKVSEKEANRHIREAMKRITSSKAEKSPLTKEQMSVIAGIKTYKDFARAFEQIPWKAAPVVYTKLDAKTLPIKPNRLKELGIDLETMANELREPAYEGIGPGTLLAIAEYDGKPPEYRPELNENYPYFVGLKDKAFLKEFTEVTKLTSRPDVVTKSGKPNSAVLMGAGVKLDKLSSGEVKFSPQRINAEHAKAVDSGDTDSAQRMVQEAARRAGYNLGPLYHGTWQKDEVLKGRKFVKREPFNSFKIQKRGSTNTPINQWGVFLTPNKQGAEVYADFAGRNKAGGERRIVNAMVKMENPYTAEFKVVGRQFLDYGSMDNQVYKTKTQASKAAKEFKQDLVDKGHDGIILTDNDGNPYEVIVFDPAQIKSADPATYNKNGNLIPLSERFKETTTDIRFSPQRELNNRGGAVYTNERGDRAVQTSSRAGVRVYESGGKRIGPVFASIEKAERHLAKMEQ